VCALDLVDAADDEDAGQEAAGENVGWTDHDAPWVRSDE